MPDADWWQALWPDPAGVLTACGVKAGMDVVDLCAGDGWFTLPLANIARTVIAIDIDAALLALAKTRVAGGANLDWVTFVEADAYDIAKTIRGPVDYVFLGNAFHGVPDKPRLAGAVRDVLKSGGLFGIVNWYRRPREETVVLGNARGPATQLRMSPTETIDTVSAVGLKHRFTVDVSPYHYGAIFSRDD